MVRYQEIRESGRLKRREVMDVRGGPSGGGKERGRRDGVEVRELGVGIITVHVVLDLQYG